MTTDPERLFFSGMRWSAAYLADTMNLRAGDEQPSPRRGYAQPPGVLQWAGPDDLPTKVFFIAVTNASAGRAWMASEPSGIWMSFAEIDLVNGDGADALRFVQRHGDPHDQLARGLQIQTATWVESVFGLSQAALGWDNPDAEGISYPTTHPVRRSLAGEALARFLVPDAARDCDVIPDPRYPRLAIRARTLHAFMLASAASAFRRGAALRKCQHCQAWFEVRRKDMVFCDASCRGAAAAKERMEALSRQPVRSPRRPGLSVVAEGATPSKPSKKIS